MVGLAYPLFTVTVHEIGHALGLYHSGVITADMYANYSGTKSALTSDDTAGIRNIYSNNNPRSPDAFGSLNNSFSAAANLTSSIDPTSLTALVGNLDITNAGEKDYYSVTAPAGTGGTVTVSVQSQGLSLLAPTLTVYAADQVTVLGSASGSGHYGTTLTLNLTNKVSAGQVFYVKVGGADTTALGTGAYALTLSFAGNPLPAVPLPNTQVANGSPLSGGGGQANAISQEFRVNATTGYLQQTFAQSQAVATDAQGDFVVTWAGSGKGGNGWAVYAQRFNAGGVPQGPEFQVNATAVGDQTYPSVAMDARGDFVITWSGNSQGASGWDIYAQRYNPKGIPQGGEFRVNTTTAGDQEFSNAAMDAGGNFVITWSSHNQDGSGWGVYAQRYNAAGVPQGGEFQVNTYTAGDQTDARVAMGPGGNFVITWMSNGQDGSGWGVYAQQYTASGQMLGKEFRVNTTTAGDQAYPAVALDAAGDFVITWSSQGQDASGWGVYAQQYSAGGAAVGGEFRVNTTTAGDQMFSGVAMQPDGSFLITWSSDAGGSSGTKLPVLLGQNSGSWDNSGDDGASLSLSQLLSAFGVTVSGHDSGATGWDVYAQQFDETGTPVGTEFRVNTTTAGDQHFASVAISPSGQAIVVWSGNGTGDPTGVFAQTYAIGQGNFDAPDAGATGSVPATADDTGLGSIGRQPASLPESGPGPAFGSAPVAPAGPTLAALDWQRWITAEAVTVRDLGPVYFPACPTRQSADDLSSESSPESPGSQAIPLPAEPGTPPAGEPARSEEEVIAAQPGIALAPPTMDRCFAGGTWNTTSADRDAHGFAGTSDDVPLDPASLGLALTALLGGYHWGQPRAREERKGQPSLA